MSATDGAFEGHEELVAKLRANPPVAPERLRERVLALGSARRRLPRRRLVLVVVPVAVALAVGAALVHGFVSSGSNRSAPKATLGGSHESAAGKAPNAPASPSTTVATGEQALAPVHTPSVYKSITIPRNRLVHADATLQVQVASRSALSRATNKATQIVASLGGYAQSVRYESSRAGYGNAFLALRVPVDKAETAIGRLGALGKLISQTVSTRDLQQQLTRQTNQIGSLRRAIAVYEQALKSGSLSASERVQIQIELSNARHSVTLLRKARSGTIASGATADVSLTLTTNRNAIVPVQHKSGRFDRFLGSAAGFLGLEGIIVLYALVVLGPVLVLGGLGWWIVRERRRREESRLLAST